MAVVPPKQYLRAVRIAFRRSLYNSPKYAELFVALLLLDESDKLGESNKTLVPYPDMTRRVPHTEVSLASTADARLVQRRFFSLGSTREKRNWSHIHVVTGSSGRVGIFIPSRANGGCPVK